jgi:hypothetical protein
MRRLPNRVTGLVLMAIFTASCSSVAAQTNEQPLAVRVEAGDSTTRLVLVAAPGLRINARLKPALELSGGEIIRFDAPLLTPDSAYFAEPPSARLPGRATTIHGTLKASACAVGERVCRLLVLRL